MAKKGRAGSRRRAKKAAKSDPAKKTAKDAGKKKSAKKSSKKAAKKSKVSGKSKKSGKSKSSGKSKKSDKSKKSAKTSSAKVVSLEGPVFDASDYTFLLKKKGHLKKKRHRDFGDVEVEINDPKGGAKLTGRALICKAYKGKAISVTVRKEQIEGKPRNYSVNPKAKFKSAFEPDDDPRKGVFTIKAICELISKFVFSNDGEPVSGLLLISGLTNSAKTLVARGLVHNYLFGGYIKDRFRLDRRMHLVTYEDPIEQLLFDFDSDSFQKPGMVDYTPRQKNTDARSLNEVTTNALRQTPTVLYVGEIRTEKDWQSAVDFAGTGHFAVATTHAGSVKETMGRAFEILKAETSDRRGEVARKLFAIVNQRRMVVETGGTNTSVIMPSVWKNTESAITKVMSEGVDSIVPTNPTENEMDDREREICSLGRQWFVRTQKDAVRKGLFREILTRAIEWDLRGE